MIYTICEIGFMIARYSTVLNKFKLIFITSSNLTCLPYLTEARRLTFPVNLHHCIETWINKFYLISIHHRTQSILHINWASHPQNKKSNMIQNLLISKIQIKISSNVLNSSFHVQFIKHVPSNKTHVSMVTKINIIII